MTSTLRCGAIGQFWPYRTGAMQDRASELRRIHLPRTWVNKNVCCYSRAVTDRSLYSMLHYARGLAGPSKQLPGVCLGLGVYVTNMPLGIPRCAGTPRQ